MASTTSTITVHASKDAVWDALTNPAAVKEYFFGTNLDTSWEPGTPIYFRGEWEGKSYEDKGTVLAFTPEQSLSYTYLSGMSDKEDVPENYQTLVYTVAETSEGETLITISQENVASEEAAKHSEENWNGVLKSLKEYVEKKSGE